MKNKQDEKDGPNVVGEPSSKGGESIPTDDQGSEDKQSEQSSPACVADAEFDSDMNKFEEETNMSSENGEEGEDQIEQHLRQEQIQAELEAQQKLKEMERLQQKVEELERRRSSLEMEEGGSNKSSPESKVEISSDGDGSEMQQTKKEEESESKDSPLETPTGGDNTKMQHETKEDQSKQRRSTLERDAAENSSPFFGSSFPDSPTTHHHHHTEPSSGLRQIKKRSISHQNDSSLKRRVPTYELQSNGSTISSEIDTSDDDIESQSRKSGKDGDGKPRAAAAAARNRVSAKVLLRKIVMAIITDIDDETLRREDTEPILIIITLLKEAMLGIVIAFVLVSCILFVDHVFLLKLQTARNMRKATFAIMNDKETLSNFEENAGMKFMGMDEYDSAMQEIAQSVNKTKLGESIINIREKDLAEMKSELAVVSDELPRIMTSLDLDAFCDDCKWGMGMTCMGRVQALEDTYKTPKFEAMVSAMQKPSCKKSDAEMAKVREENEKVDAIMKDWDKHEKEFCNECFWDGGTTCSSRASFISYRYGLGSDRAKATIMSQTDKCNESVRIKEKAWLDRFCPTCIWGNKLSCKQRVEYLKYTYNNEDRQATLSAMEKPSCVGPEVVDTV